LVEVHQAVSASSKPLWISTVVAMVAARVAMFEVATPSAHREDLRGRHGGLSVPGNAWG
jgi:hypothetical protein